MMMTSLSLLFLPLLPPAAGDVSLFVGSPGAPGTVVVTDESGSAPLEFPDGLQGVRLLALDFTGRTQLDALDPAKPRLALDVPGAARIRLPNGAGSLFKFRRDVQPGLTHFGFFVVGSDGRARLTWEWPGIGPAGDVDPFSNQVAIDPSGTGMLVTTDIGAGGNLYEVDLVTGGAIDRTPAQPPLSFEPGGLLLLPSWGVATSVTNAVRFDRSGGAAALDLVFTAPVPTWFGGGLAASADGNVAALVAGADPAQADVFVFDSGGVAERVTGASGSVSSAGYLPEFQHGPYLALSHDGQLCAWRTEGATREAWLGRTGVAQPPPVQMTKDGVYTDTLDEAGLFGFMLGGDLLFAIGKAEQIGAPGIEAMDLHRASLDAAGGVNILNATLSSGDPIAPFDNKPTLTPDQLLRLPGSDSFLLHDSKANQVLFVDVLAGTAAVALSDVKTLEQVSVTSSHLLATVRRENQIGMREVHAAALSTGSIWTEVLSLPVVADIGRFSVRADGTVGFIAGLGSTEWLLRYTPAADSLTLLLDLPLPYGPSLAATPGNALAFTVGSVGSPAVHLTWQATGGLTLVPLPAVPGFLLAGE